MTRRRHYDYNAKPRSWRKERVWGRLRVFLMLGIGLSIAGYIVYLAVVK